MWLIWIVLIRVLSIWLGAYKRHTIEIRHTIGNKATGFFLFLSVYFIPFVNFDKIAIFLCLVATLSALEELLIILKVLK